MELKLELTLYCLHLLLQDRDTLFATKLRIANRIMYFRKCDIVNWIPVLVPILSFIAWCQVSEKPQTIPGAQPSGNTRAHNGMCRLTTNDRISIKLLLRAYLEATTLTGFFCERMLIVKT